MNQQITKTTEKTSQRKLVKLRERIKEKKPHFRASESWRYKRVKENWRKPRGTDSKMRQNKRGWPKSVSIGYRGPKKARGLHPSGYKEILVTNVDDLLNVNSESQAIRIAHNVGAKKRFEILSRSKEKGIHILNPGEIKKPEEEKEVEEKEKAEEETEKSETETSEEKES